MSSIFLTAEWRKLAIANYNVDPAVLLPYLPYKTELDTWNGKCYVSLVGFCFINTKLKEFAIPFHRHFEEINLRFYVRYKDLSGWRRGVTFIKEIVPKPALSFIANVLYKEKYITLPVKHSWQSDNDSLSVSYLWKQKGLWNSFSVIAAPVQKVMASGSEEEFITEHYWGYTQVSKQLTSEYRVSHPRWNVYPVKEYEIDVRFGSLYGKDFSFLAMQTPDSVMLAEGSEIAVHTGVKIK